MSVAVGTRGWWLDAWMRPGTRGRGRDVRRCHCEAVLSWSTRGGCVLAVGRDAGGTRDVPLRVVHDEGERQDTDKGGYARRGCAQRAAGWTRWGSVGGGLWRDEGRPCGRGREAGGRTHVCRPTHKTEHTARGEPWADSLATEHHVMEVQTAW